MYSWRLFKKGGEDGDHHKIGGMVIEFMVEP
jgi:hypothetical protein